MRRPEVAPGRPARTRARRYRRRLRSRIILSFLLLGLGLTTLFAFLTQEARDRVENTLVEDLMNRNIDEYARRYYVDPQRNPFGLALDCHARAPERIETPPPATPPGRAASAGANLQEDTP